MRERVLLGMPTPRSGLAVVGVLTYGRMCTACAGSIHAQPQATGGKMKVVRGVPHHDHARSSTMTLGPSRASASSTIRRPGNFRGRVRVKVGLTLGLG